MSPAPDLFAIATAPALPPLSRVLIRLALVLAAWDNRRRTRIGLSRLDDHLIRDIGLEPFAAQEEAEKPFWRP